MIHPEPQRVLSITLHPEILRRVTAGRVRRLLVPDSRFARLHPGDMIWVREGLTIPARQPRGDYLGVVYGGSGEYRDLRWPSALARPSRGWLPPEAMPVHASRLTLLVRDVTEMRLQQITEDEAIAAGVDIEGGDRYGNPLVANLTGQYFDTAVEAFGRMWDCALGAESLGPKAWGCNPEVVALEIRAIARNLASLIPGVGKGGVR